MVWSLFVVLVIEIVVEVILFVVVYEDLYFIVIDKFVGLVVYLVFGYEVGMLVNVLLVYV